MMIDDRNYQSLFFFVSLVFTDASFYVSSKNGSSQYGKQSVTCETSLYHFYLIYIEARCFQSPKILSCILCMYALSLASQQSICNKHNVNYLVINHLLGRVINLKVFRSTTMISFNLLSPSNMVWEGHRQLKRDIKTIITCTSKSAEQIWQDNWMVYSMFSM